MRRELEVADEEWARGAAWALEQALGVLWCSRLTNPPAAELGRTTLGRVMAAAATLER